MTVAVFKCKMYSGIIELDEETAIGVWIRIRSRLDLFCG